MLYRLSKIIPVRMRSTYTRPETRTIIPHAEIDDLRHDPVTGGGEMTFTARQEGGRPLDFVTPSQRERATWWQWRGHIWRHHRRIVGVIEA